MSLVDNKAPSTIGFDRACICWRVQINGLVQGVGFRPFVKKMADLLGVTGWVRNTSMGVVCLVQGRLVQVENFVHALRSNAPPLAYLFEVVVETVDSFVTSETFEIVPSETALGRTLISPDIAVCDACLHELFDAKDLRYHYPFLNCTNCGPRFTIVQDMPYDRGNTTMQAFGLCSLCQSQYRDVHDRRFHAQPIACPVCGPVVWFARADGNKVCQKETAIDLAIRSLEEGQTLAIKGLGGFHIACLAQNEKAVTKLRASKFRPSKPFALMVPSVEMAHAFAEVDEMAERVLKETEAPIVLLRKRPHRLPDVIAPQNAYVGVMLPYTPLHHLLLERIGAPLVMTSGNVSGAPLCKDNDDAIEKLGRFVDGFVLHNRPIERRCDDSVVMLTNHHGSARVQPVRRSRGFAPLPVFLPASLALSKDVVGVGGDLKNVSGVGSKQQVFLSAHIGDLAHPQAREEQRSVVEDLSKLFNIHPQVVVSDLHPQYVSTMFAQAWANQKQVPHIRVQHHHAHIVSCMVDAGVQDGQVIGLAFDGTGYGTDGRIWGGEALICDWMNFARPFHLQYLPLPGGDHATLKPYRIAMAYLHTLLPDQDVMQFVPGIDEGEVQLVWQMLEKDFNVTQTSSMGRLFDAVSALLGLCVQTTHEGQAAMALEAVAEAGKKDLDTYPLAFDGTDILLRDFFASMVEDLRIGCAVSDIAYRFHATVATLAREVAKRIRETQGINRVALSGGVWQNRLLYQMAVRELMGADFDVLVHRAVPCNDGGLALGQIAIASAMIKEEGYVLGRSGKD